MRIVPRLTAVSVILLIASAAAAQQSWTDDPVVAGDTPIKVVHVLEMRQRIDALRQERGLLPATYTSRPRQGDTIRVSHFTETVSALAAVCREDGVEPPTYGRVAPGEPIRALTINALRAAIDNRGDGRVSRWRGLEIAPLVRKTYKTGVKVTDVRMQELRIIHPTAPCPNGTTPSNRCSEKRKLFLRRPQVSSPISRLRSSTRD